MTPLQQLTDKIYASNPELKKLGVGCEIDFPLAKKIGDSDNGIYTIVGKDTVYRNITFKKGEAKLGFFTDIVQDYDGCTIIGKPPTLVDVLKWFIESENSVEKIINFQTYLLRLWNLNSIYLRDQEEALINFFNNLDNGL